MGKRYKSTQKWKCINVSCNSVNTLGSCFNCGYDTYGLSSYLTGVRCNNCDDKLYNLICPKCKTRTPLDKSGIHFPSCVTPCFIATATYGSPQAQEVILLSQYRDTYLRKNTFGRTIINIYECVSPPIANWIASKQPARKFVRQVIIPPFLWIARRKIK